MKKVKNNSSNKIKIKIIKIKLMIQNKWVINIKNYKTMKAMKDNNRNKNIKNHNNLRIMLIKMKYKIKHLVNNKNTQN